MPTMAELEAKKKKKLQEAPLSPKDFLEAFKKGHSPAEVEELKRAMTQRGAEAPPEATNPLAQALAAEKPAPSKPDIVQYSEPAGPPKPAEPPPFSEKGQFNQPRMMLQYAEQYPGLQAQINRDRQRGKTDEEIGEAIFQTQRKHQQAGMTPQQAWNFMANPEVVQLIPPKGEEFNPLGAALNVGHQAQTQAEQQAATAERTRSGEPTWVDIIKGAKSGLTLGYVEDEGPHNWARFGGEMLGGAAPTLAASALAAPLIPGTGLAIALARTGLAGGMYGMAHQADTMEERLLNTGFNALAWPAMELGVRGAYMGGGALVKALRGRGGRPPTPEAPPPSIPPEAPRPPLGGQAIPEEIPRAEAAPSMEAELSQIMAESRADAASELTTLGKVAGASEAPMPIEPAIAKLAEKYEGQIPPGAIAIGEKDGTVIIAQDPVKALAETPEKAIAGGSPGRGRPPSRALVPELSDAEARVTAAHRLARTQNITKEAAVEQTSKMNIMKARILANQELLEFRKASGELTGKVGRPATGSVKEITLGGETTIEDISAETAGEVGASLRKAEMRTAPPPPVEPAVTLSSLRKDAGPRGFDISFAGDHYEVVAPGGAARQFKTLDEVRGFVGTKPVVPRQPIEVGTPVAEPEQQMSTFEKLAKGVKLDEADQARLATQQQFFESTKKALVGDTAAKDAGKVVPQVPQIAKVELPEGKLMGTVQGIESPDEIALIKAKVEEIGAKVKFIRVGDEGVYDAIYYKNMNKDVSKAIDLYNKQMEKGPRSLTDAEHNLLAKALGKTPTEAADYLAKVRGTTTQAPPPGPDIPIMGGKSGIGDRVHLANPLIQPINSGSPQYKLMSVQTSKAEAAHHDEFAKWSTYLKDKIESQVGNDPALRRKAMDYVQGDITAAQAGPKAVQAGEAYKVAMRDFAERLGLPQWDNYVTHKTDFDAVFSAFRKEFVKATNIHDLPPQVQLSLGSTGNFDRLKAAFTKATDWQAVPAGTREDIKKMWNFKGIASNWESLPKFVQDKLPKEIFDPYLLPRSEKEVPYVHDIVEAFREYVPKALHKIHYDPLVAKWGRITNMMPGDASSIFTEKGLMQKYIETVMLNRPAVDDKIVSVISDKVNEFFGKNFIDPAKVNFFVSMARSGLYRGALGLESAVANLTQSVNTWMETGRLLGPLGKFVQKYGQVKEKGKFFGDMESLMHEELARGKVPEWMNKARDFDSKLNNFFLAPFAQAEFMNRGVAFLSGMEDAIAKGMDDVNLVLVNSAAKASRVVPNLQMTDAMMQAMFETVPKTQFGATASQRAPILTGPLGRLSTLFLTYPTQQAAFLYRGSLDAWASGDKAKLARYILGAGAFVGLPTLLLQAGVDIRSLYGANGVMGNLTFPVYRQLYNAYHAVLGRDPGSREKAQEDFKKFVETMTIPQFRYGSKLVDIYQNISRGYAIDKHGRKLYETTPAGELLRAAGIGPERAFQSRELTSTLVQESMQYSYDKKLAVEGLLKGDPTAASVFTRKWHKPISPADIQRELKLRMMTPEQRAGRNLPREFRYPMMGVPGEE